MGSMNMTLLWIIVAIVVVVLILIGVLVAVGNRRKKAKTVSFDRKDDAPKELTQQEKSGNYQAAGGFAFSPAGTAQPVSEPVLRDDQDLTPRETPQAEPETPVFEDVAEDVIADDADRAEIEETTQEPVIDPREEAEEAAEAAASTADAAAEAKEQTPPPAAEPAPAPAPAPTEEIAPAAGRLGRLRGNLSRSQNALGQGLLGVLTAGDLDEDAWEEIEDTLIMADLGSALTMKVTESLRHKFAERGVTSEAEARAMLRETLIEAGRPELDRSIKAVPSEGKPAVILVVGVNGTGKTTTTGKLARVLVSMGHKVLLGAADTFRAAAADQLETWGRRVGATTVRGKEGADPAAVAFDAVARGVEERADVVIIDTAGRLHTATGLMDQLGKVKRVVEKKSAVDEVLLVLDATVGQNGLMQARVFREVVDITGVVLTKLDGTAKGGIVFQVQEELGVPVKLVGLGEGADHLAPFEVEGFVDALLGS
ncbi:signal recognition particle-docking protein FtsY [Corynebacterium doosanense]|nr:signal recognition particle-docking protein FtsY [Corynebacterium doosanense]